MILCATRDGVAGFLVAVVRALGLLAFFVIAGAFAVDSAVDSTVVSTVVSAVVSAGLGVYFAVWVLADIFAVGLGALCSTRVLGRGSSLVRRIGEKVVVGVR